MHRDEPCHTPEEQRISSVLCSGSAPPSKGMSIVYLRKRNPLRSLERNSPEAARGHDTRRPGFLGAVYLSPPKTDDMLPLYRAAIT